MTCLVGRGEVGKQLSINEEVVDVTGHARTDKLPVLGEIHPKML